MKPTDAVRRMTNADLWQVFEWRNHPDIRPYMYRRSAITREEHLAWFEKASEDPDRHLLIYERNGVPSGFISLTPSMPGGPIADWGFYVAPGSTPGTGKGLGGAALRYAFHRLRLHKVCGQVLESNPRSISFHKSLGFVEEGRLREQYFDGQDYQDIICLGLLAHEWLDMLGGSL